MAFQEKFKVGDKVKLHPNMNHKCYIDESFTKKYQKDIFVIKKISYGYFGYDVVYYCGVSEYSEHLFWAPEKYLMKVT